MKQIDLANQDFGKCRCQVSSPHRQLAEKVDLHFFEPTQLEGREQIYQEFFLPLKWEIDSEKD